MPDTSIQQDKELRELRESLMPVIEQEILESGFLDEHDKNVGGDLYTPQNNQKLTASAIADILSVKLQPFIQARDKELTQPYLDVIAQLSAELEELSS